MTDDDSVQSEVNAAAASRQFWRLVHAAVSD